MHLTTATSCHVSRDGGGALWVHGCWTKSSDAFYCPQPYGPRPVDSGAASAGSALDDLAKDITMGGNAWHSCRKHFQKIIRPGPAYGPIRGAVAEYGKLKLTELPE